MKYLSAILCSLFFFSASAQQKAENIIIITTDGFRWQDLFKGMDSAIANSSQYNEDDSAYIFKKYWAATATERRKKLLPFLWEVMAADGQVYGNRTYGNKVDNFNPYWFSYPGYSEIMTGFADTAINSNGYKPNPNETVLEFFNKQTNLKGKVAAFGAWEAFNRILNEERSGIPVVAAFDAAGGKSPNANEKLINAMLKDSYKPFGEEECMDVFTHYAALEHLKTRKPKVLYISYGETDEWAHSGKYKSYLDAAHQADAWIKQIWDFVQQDPQYKGKTAILFTTDHGRGDLKKSEWTSHNNRITDAHEIWFAVMGPGVKATGEQKQPRQIYQQQFAQTMARLMGMVFKTNHPVAGEVGEVFR